MERRVEILSSDSPKWNEYLECMPYGMQDVYFTSKYNSLEESEVNAKAINFVYMENNDKIGMYTFIKRPITYMDFNEKYYDIQTVYGYGGPLVNTSDSGFASRFECEFIEYCKNENIVAEFVRFHPLIKNENIFKKHIQVIHNRKTVALDLTQNIDDIWMKQISTQNRNTIRKCVKNGLFVKVTDDYSSFTDIYNETMRKVNADDFYSFSSDYFETFKNDIQSILMGVFKDNKMIASAIFMEYGEYFHYHLSGSRKDSLHLAPNNILLWEAIKYAKEHGYKKMHFGGGMSDSTDDSLFRFKSHFSKEYYDFYIGKRVHNKDIYNELISRWENKSNRKASMLLQYRM